MKRVAPPILEPQVVARLAALQQSIDQIQDYAERVTTGKAKWDKRPEALFNHVRSGLALTCSGNRRCHYCEDSMADEIEHMRPKDLYPEGVFQLSNYLLSCGPCNGPKNNQFAVILGSGAAGPELMDVTRRRNALVTPPQAGVPALLDIRVDDPIECIWLDFQTGLYTSNVDDPGSEISLRVDYTLRLLRLNTRDDLVRGRRAAYSMYLARLRMFVEYHSNWTDVERSKFIEDFRVERYRSVWERMMKYREFTPELDQLFASRPLKYQPQTHAVA